MRDSNCWCQVRLRGCREVVWATEARNTLLSVADACFPTDANFGGNTWFRGAFPPVFPLLT